MSRRPLPRVAFAAAMALLLAFQGRSVQAGSDSPSGVALVSIHPATATAPEGEQVVVRIQRDRDRGDLRVALKLGGDATLEDDYVLEGCDRINGSGATVVVPDGQLFVELTLKVAEDAPAESDEEAVLEIQANPGYAVDGAAGGATVAIPRNDFVVTTKDDAGQGSLRQAILNANLLEGHDTITFDSTLGPFATPQVIALAADLPPLVGELTIDGYLEKQLWKPSGVTVSGNGERRVFHVAEGARVTLESLTIADGRAKNGGGIANEGTLIVKGVTFSDNEAVYEGGALANRRGHLTVINSTFKGNRAGKRGGALANVRAVATVTNCTFSDNEAERGGGLFSRGELLLRNTILANSVGGADCVTKQSLVVTSTHNLIESNDGCGAPISSEDPLLEPLGYYNGPAKTIPVRAGSPAINLGDNASAVDENGKPLVWDQRGNGDPRFVAGYTDIGAFERQAHAVLTVDTIEDNGLRGCTRSGPGDCPLRAAIELANANALYDVVRFDPDVFATPQTITLTRRLPEITADLTVDAGETASVTVIADGEFRVFEAATGITLKLAGVRTMTQHSPLSPIPHSPADADR